jgi:hypothetical protein
MIAAKVIDGLGGPKTPRKAMLGEGDYTTSLRPRAKWTVSQNRGVTQN